MLELDILLEPFLDESYLTLEEEISSVIHEG